jgi:hypothetical protein
MSSKRKRSGTAATSGKRVKKATQVLHSIVLLQQSSVFNDKQQARSVAPSDQRLAEQRALLNALDARTLRRFSDSLCVDMQSWHTLDKMQAVSGDQDSRCICGTPRLPNAPWYTVRTGTGVHSAQLCRACGRFSNSYQRFCVNGPKVKSAIRAANRQQDRSDAAAATNSATSEELSASSDSLDKFVDHLLSILEHQSTGDTVNTTTTTSANDSRPPKRSRTGRGRRNLFHTPSEPPTPAPLTDADSQLSTFNYGNRVAHCRHASLTALEMPAKDNALIAQMFGGK